MLFYRSDIKNRKQFLSSFAVTLWKSQTYTQCTNNKKVIKMNFVKPIIYKKKRHESDKLWFMKYKPKLNSFVTINVKNTSNHLGSTGSNL